MKLIQSNTHKDSPAVSLFASALRIFFWALLLTLLVAPVTGLGNQSAKRSAEPEIRSTKSVPVQRGEYLVMILGCGGCHTEGGLEGLPYGPNLAGSKVGIAYSNPANNEQPAIVFPTNLTPHRRHGLGRWSREDIARAIRNGINHTGGEVITVMPWLNYRLLNDQDTYDIVDYLQSLEAVDYSIPDNISRGEPSSHEYLRIGVYRFSPMNPGRPKSIDGYNVEKTND